MQELRFVGLEDDWLIATNDDGERFRLRADEAVRDALRPRPAARPEGPRVPPREIQQLIRAGRTVEEVVELTGADAETVSRFEGPILAERGYIVEQARAVAVRLQTQIDPLSRDGATFGSTIDDRLEQLAATDVRWDAWKDPESGWHVGLDFVTEDVARNALWKFDPRSHTLQPSSAAAITLSQQGEPTSLMGPHLRAVKREPTDRVIPVHDLDQIEEVLSTPDPRDLTTHETADLLEALRRRRGERQHSTYDEEAEFGLDDIGGAGASGEPEEALPSRVTPFARPAAQTATIDSTTVSDASDDQFVDATQDSTFRDSAFGDSAFGDSAFRDAGSRTHTAQSAEAAPPQAPLESLEPEPTSRGSRPKLNKRRGGRPSMPSWDEIVFGTKGDDE